MSKILNENHVVLSLQTLSTSPKAGIIQIAATKFNVKDGIFDNFNVNISPFDNRKYPDDIDISSSTLKWWTTQPKVLRDALAANQVTLLTAIKSFNDWFHFDQSLVWTNGNSFYIPVLNNVYNVLGVKRPFEYYKEMDIRTISVFCDYPYYTKNSHNSVLDVENQATHLLKLFKAMSGE